MGVQIPKRFAGEVHEKEIKQFHWNRHELFVRTAVDKNQKESLNVLKNLHLSALDGVDPLIFFFFFGMEGRGRGVRRSPFPPPPLNLIV